MILIGIGGPSTSGKTTICKYLAKRYKTFYIEGDNYFKNKENIPTKGRWRNWELPKNIKFDLLFENLSDLKNGISTNLPIYCFETGELQEYNFEDEIRDIDLYWKNGENYFTISWNNDYVHEWETGEEVLIVEDVDILIDMAESIQPYDTTDLEVLGCEIWSRNIYSNLGICDAIPV